MIPTLHEILENRQRWRLCWHEPVPAKTGNQNRTANRIVSMMVYEAVDAQRFVADNAKPDHGLDDYRLLQDFIAVHYAWTEMNMGDHAA